ncbi:Probable membrane-associated kinase regulator 6 [Linum perenne]
METSSSRQLISIESFSYRWIANLDTTSSDHDQDSNRSSFVDTDPRMSTSKRFFFGNSHDFDFDVDNIHHRSSFLVHADELFSNGYLVPGFFTEPINNSSPNSVDELDLGGSGLVPGMEMRRSRSLKRCGELTKRVLEKYYLEYFLRPLCQRFRHNGRRRSGNIAVGNKLGMERSNSSSSSESESSIYEAVLHCKRSFGIVNKIE